ncbi:hypothetical protein ACUSIJ_24875 [Pseudochelatococcus sp. B33]
MGKGSKPHRSSGKRKGQKNAPTPVVVIKGRAREQVKREANGRPSRAGTQNPRLVALSQPHRAWLPEAKRADQRAESLLGQLRLLKLITQAQYQAGVKWRKLMMEFHAVMASPAMPNGPLARIAAGERHGDAAPVHGGSSAIETEEERRDRVLRSLGDVGAGLREIGHSKQAFSSLEAVILYDRTLDDYAHLFRGLNALVRLWKISEYDEDEGVDTDEGVV